MSTAPKALRPPSLRFGAPGFVSLSGHRPGSDVGLCVVGFSPCHESDPPLLLFGLLLGLFVEVDLWLGRRLIYPFDEGHRRRITLTEAPFYDLDVTPPREHGLA